MGNTGVELRCVERLLAQGLGLRAWVVGLRA